MPYKHLKQWQEHLPDTTFIVIFLKTKYQIHHIVWVQRDIIAFYSLSA